MFGTVLDKLSYVVQLCLSESLLYLHTYMYMYNVSAHAITTYMYLPCG